MKENNQSFEDKRKSQNLNNKKNKSLQIAVFLGGVICGVILGLLMSKCPSQLPLKEKKEEISEEKIPESKKEEERTKATKIYISGERITPQIISAQKITGAFEQLTQQVGYPCDIFPFSVSIVDPPPLLLNKKIIDVIFTSGITLSCSVWSEEHTMDFPCELQSPRLTLFFSLDGTKLFKVMYRQDECFRELFSFNFIVDTQPPETKIMLKGITSSEIEVLTVPDAEFEIITSEPVAYTLCRVDDGLWFDCSFHKLYFTSIEEGWHELWAFSVDLAGNEETEKKVLRFRVDARPPTTILISAPTSVTSFASAIFKFKADEENVKFECNIDDTGWIPCSSPFEISDLKLGYHTIRIRAIDSFGRVDPEPLVYSWQIVGSKSGEVRKGR